MLALSKRAAKTIAHYGEFQIMVFRLVTSLFVMSLLLCLFVLVCSLSVLCYLFYFSIYLKLRLTCANLAKHKTIFLARTRKASICNWFPANYFA